MTILIVRRKIVVRSANRNFSKKYQIFSLKRTMNKSKKVWEGIKCLRRVHND